MRVPDHGGRSERKTMFARNLLPFLRSLPSLRALRFVTALAGALAVAHGAAAAEKLVIAATEVPHAEILEFVKPILAKAGVYLDIKVFSDYVQPNLQLADKQVDLN